MAYAKLLRSKHINISADLRGRAVCAAVKNGYLELTRSLLAAGKEIPQLFRERAVIIAASDENLDLLEILLPEEEEISDECRGKAFVAGALSFSVVEFLLSNGNQISSTYLEHGVRKAAAEGYFETIMFLLDEDANISDDCMVYSILQAGNHENWDAVEFLLSYKFDSSNYLEKIPVEDRNVAVLCAAVGGDLELLTSLLGVNSNTSINTKGEALQLAAMRKYSDIVRYLLNNGEDVPLDFKANALINFAMGDNLADDLATAEELFLSGDPDLSVQIRGEAICAAIARGNFVMALELLRDGQEISEEHAGKAVVCAADEEAWQVVSLLVDKLKNIPPKDLGEVLVKAADKNNLETVRAIIDSGGVVEFLMR